MKKGTLKSEKQKAVADTSDSMGGGFSEHHAGI